MDNWLILQFAVDILLFVILVILIVKSSKGESKPEIPNIEEMRAIVAKFDKSLDQGEALLRKIEGELKDSGNALAMQDLVQRQKASAALKKDKETTRSLEKLEEILVDKPIPRMNSMNDRKKYVKALHKQGVPLEEIGKRLSISLSEIELMIAMLESES